MKNCYFLFICTFVLSMTAFAQEEQRTVIIEPGGVDAVFAAVEADLAATDTATVSSTKYILRRDAVYPFVEEWRPTYPLHLEAEEGDGKRPVMLAVHPASGQAPSFCRVLNSFEWRGISFPGVDSDDQHGDNAPFRPRGDGFTSVIDDNLVENQRLDALRMDGSDQNCYFTNNIIRNGYQRNLWDKGGGALFMPNGGDTVIWNHNTYFNSTCVVGYQNDGGVGLDYLEFKNNTIVNVGGLQQPGQYSGVARHAAINLGTPQTAIVENNIFHNISYMGIDSQFADRHFVFLINITDSTNSIVFRNNNFYQDETLMAVPIPDTAVDYRTWNPAMDSVVAILEGGGTVDFDLVYENNISEALTFNNPASEIDEAMMVKELYWSNPAEVTIQELILDLSKDLYDLDYGYQTDAMSYTHGTDGLPLGAQRWHDVETNTIDYNTQSDFVVRGNFPNPFTEMTTISFDLKETAMVEVTVYDLQGRVVQTSQKQVFGPGEDHQIQIHANSLTPGMYPYKVTTELGAGVVETARIMVVK